MKTSVNKTCLIGPAIAREQFIAEHLFFYLVQGTMSGYYDGKNYTLHSGEYGIARKNRLSRQVHAREEEKAEKIIFVFDEPFLKAFQKKYDIVAAKNTSGEPFLHLPANNLIAPFIQSLMPYHNDRGEINKAFFDVKREELLLVLLQLQPGLSGVFFDYGIPAKIDLEAFMNRNYRFHVQIGRFAFLTGRSLSAFKRDFYATFNETPSRWLLRKRLEDAYFLIETGNKKPSDIYLDLGFEALSHFSFAFKKLFGLTPTQLADRKTSA